MIQSLTDFVVWFQDLFTAAPGPAALCVLIGLALLLTLAAWIVLDVR